MRIITRYLFREMIGPTFLGFAFYTFIILMRNLFDFAEMIIKRSLPIRTVFELLGLTLPNIVVLTIPMALLFGILIAIGRLSADSEIIAMRTAGISTTTIYRPVLYFSFALFLLNLYLMNTVLPRGNTALERLKAEIATSVVEKKVQPRVFYDEYENLLIYINDVDPLNGSWRGVFVSDTTDAESQKIHVAQTGSLSIVGPQKELWLELRDAKTHVTSSRKGDKYDLVSNALQRVRLIDEFAQGADLTRRKSYRAMGLEELIVEARRPVRELPAEDRRIVWVEIHKKFAIPFACLAFGIVGLPLGITNRRGGKSSGFTLSIAIIMVYYVLIANGEDMARAGRVSPALSMWAPNLILVAFGVYLIRRANTDRGTHQGGGILSRLIRLAERLLLRRQKKGAVVDDRSSILTKLDIAFPNILDRYLLSQFIRVLLLVLVSTAALWIIVDYREVGSEVTENHVDFSVVTSYYRYFVLQVIQWTLPISVLVSTLITFGIMAKNNEVVALKANGVSLYRTTVPILAVAVIISGLSYLLLDFVLPYSNRRVEELRNQIRGKARPHSFSVQQKQWLFGKGRYLFNFLALQNEGQVLTQIQVLEFAPDRFVLTRRVYAEEARFDGVGWVFVNGWIRSFGDDGSLSFTPMRSPVRLHYPERPEYFSTEVKAPSQMTYRELREYIRRLQNSGYSANELLVDLYEKTSWPFVTLVMAMIALPFSFRIGKRGTLYGVGVALLLAFVYWTLFGVFTKFGEIGNLPPILSAWSANILFAIAAMYLFLRVET